MNLVIMTGRLANDPKTSYGKSSQVPVTRFPLALERGNDKEGNSRGVDYPSIVCFGKTAEIVEKYLAKGIRVGIVGHIHTDSYENREGKKVYTTEVIVDRLEFLDNKRDTQEIAGKKDERAYAKNINKTSIASVDDSYSDDFVPEGFMKIDSEDIPF